ncbi:hypothetical protein A1Q1_03668 [Trichosporon asahii var. asahii CBS 2479]|uniref:non-specific serine/threonine protein kinase n=1 Tax=Trichosporon asahii var. asahii (strain ATCC 90039 / CBS 2479 / JCM 2466 / KCTC 7840 / NBRC 103889/ NCYC 2677 / UAMH 7654) TaxID=1186058 RepID=J5TSJ3_TRIAS|nr:hypothetical protein A1Q1_03668 [Trichosporon asahii var. asahii CBS 2479]EJT52536.1 hypothetical protein A1Q1_03668 [Trichosporon asahii var. asahii CBS 2479]
MDVGTSKLHYPLIAGYRIGEEIGGAIDDEHSKVAACKVVNVFVSSTQHATPNVKELQKEVQVHKSLKNSYILEFLHSEIVDKAKEAAGVVPGLYMLLELAVGGDLFDKIVGIPEDLAKFYFAQLASGIGIAHRDLKPENLLLAANGNLKITDFGLCAVFRYKGKERLLSGRCGSLPYVAPEPYKAEPVDIWGMGVVLFTMLVGNTPWDEPSENAIEFRAYVNGEIWQYDPWCRIRGQAQTNHQTLAAYARADSGGSDARNAHDRNDVRRRPNIHTRRPSRLCRRRVFGNSQWSSQWNQQESQFMRGTGNLTQGGDFDNNTTRFWLALDPADAFALMQQYLVGLLEEHNVQVNAGRNAIRVHKAAGQKSVTGVFLLKASDTHAPSGQTLVSMRREKVS